MLQSLQCFNSRQKQQQQKLQFTKYWYVRSVETTAINWNVIPFNNRDTLSTTDQFAINLFLRIERELISIPRIMFSENLLCSWKWNINGRWCVSRLLTKILFCWMDVVLLHRVTKQRKPLLPSLWPLQFYACEAASTIKFWNSKCELERLLCDSKIRRS